MTGPFNAVGITAEYLVIQCILLTHYLLNIQKIRKLIVVILVFNIGILVGTGSRGSFISFLVSVFFFISFFRKSIGIKRITVMIPAFFIILLLPSYIMIKHTQFNVLYQRLQDTEMEGVVPETRFNWPYIVDRILEKPLFGHGPYILTTRTNTRSIRLPKGNIYTYPHNLYLFILYTVGLSGIFAYSFWAVSYVKLLIRSKKRLMKKDTFISELPKLGILVFAIFLLDQMKIEFLRPNLLDYQHYISALLGMFCSLKKIDIDPKQESVNLNT
jgi:O-antigen ligase